MNLLHVIRSVDSAGGGPIEGIKQLSGFARSVGNGVEVASLDSPESACVTSFPGIIHAFGPAAFPYGFCLGLVAWLRSNASRFDVVIVNGIWQYHSFAVWIALRKSSTPYVVFTHGMLDPWFKRTYPLKHAKKWLYWPWAEYRVLRDAAAVLFTCEEERSLARESFWLYRANGVVINYGTAFQTGEPAAQQSAVKACFPHLAGKHTALFLGRIHPKKGCDIALEAFARSFGGDPSWHLVMAGPDQVGLQKELARRASQLGIANQLTWTGLVSGDVKCGLLRAAEVFILPSHQENFGIAVAESLSFGLPVLISNKVNIWREIEADGAGLVAEDSIEGLADSFQRWCRMTQQQKQEMRLSRAE